ncbi:hypothetical protein OAO18_03990 [Francisellaceae bacterium]|nr:hypothetical protein [Francisellaceae bacterium]
MYYVNLCGPSKDCFAETRITLSADQPLLAAELKKRLVVESNHKPAIVAQLLSSCAIATDTEILSSTTTVPENTELYLLPPVCGG